MKNLCELFSPFPCSPSCIGEFFILKLGSIWLMFITSWGGNKLAASYKMHQHDRSSLMTAMKKGEKE